VRIRDPVRLGGVKLTEAPEITFISIESKQGV